MAAADTESAHGNRAAALRIRRTNLKGHVKVAEVGGSGFAAHGGVAQQNGDAAD